MFILIYKYTICCITELNVHIAHIPSLLYISLTKIHIPHNGIVLKCVYAAVHVEQSALIYTQITVLFTQTNSMK